MADKLTPARRSTNMAKIRAKDTKPELVVRRLAHQLGYRFRLHRRELPGKPDLVFVSRRAVIFVHGCFWHQHPSEACLDGRRPKSNTDYWNAKLDRNVQRDATAQTRLAEKGWRVLTVWECETTDSETLTLRLQKFLGGAANQAR